MSDGVKNQNRKQLAGMKLFGWRFRSCADHEMNAQKVFDARQLIWAA
jgi:hypothetical protein